MKHKRWLYWLFSIAALVLEALPYGAVCRFANPEGEPWRNTYSYFSMIPFGYANFAPLLTALLTCAAVALLLIGVRKDTPSLWKAVKIVLAVAVVLSLCPLLLGVAYFSVVGALITVALTAALVSVCVTAPRKE